MAELFELNAIEVWDGNMAASHALRQAQVDVVAAYPITPSTPIVENYGTFMANGYVDGEYVMAESEHGAMSCCIGAAAAGGRVATATSSQGFALMLETLYSASGMRLPILLNVVNRAIAAPLNVNGDHSDMYMGRDSGWIQIDCYNPQDVYDMNLVAFRVSEDHDIRLPAMVHQDGFMTSHTAQRVTTLPDDVAYNFIGEYQPMNDMLDLDHPVTHGAQTEEDWHFEHKARQHHALMSDVIPKIQEAFDELKTLTGRQYNLVEKYNMDDAEIAIVCMGTSVETAEEVSNELRAQGIKAGVVGIRVFRPFPLEQIAAALKDCKAIAALDRSSPNGTVGMLFNEISGALFNTDTKTVLTNYIYGLGGRDLTKSSLHSVYRNLQANAQAGHPTTPLQQFIGLRGPVLSFF
jgi:pyruvate ferredoxin oxidoreductase alpha subunit